MRETDGALITESNLTTFFNQLVTEAIARQQFKANEEAVQYLVALLATFARPENFYERTHEGLTLRPLASLYATAIEAGSIDERNSTLKRLGDVALFIAGVFPDILNRQLVDVDYYIAMGGNAYGYLSEANGGRRWRYLRSIFAELAERFVKYVDILNDVSERSHFANNADIMRLYERWMRTGSDRIANRLRQLGIEPNCTLSSRHH